MNQLIERLKNSCIHDRKIAIARFLLALGTLLMLLCNDIDVVANRHYNALPHYHSRHTGPATGAMKKADLFMEMTPAAAKVVSIIILLCVMSGFLPQVTCLLHFWVCYSIHNYFVVTNGGDQVALIMSILLLPICFTDPRLNQWYQPKGNKPSGRNIIAGIALFIIQVQAAIIYLDSGVSKLFVKEWQDGTAIYYYTSNASFGAPGWLRSLNELFTLTPIVAVITWAIIALELLLFLCLFAPAKVKKAFLLLGLLLHFLIVINFGLISFFLTMAAVLILFLDAENNSVKLLNRLLPAKVAAMLA